MAPNAAHQPPEGAPPPAWRRLDHGLRKAFAYLSDATRLSAFLLLRPVARHLPRAWAYALATLIGQILAALPVGRRLRRSMNAGFPSANGEDVARAWLTRPFLDFIFAARVASGRENYRDLAIILRNPPDILRQPGASFIIATAHSSREAMTGLYMPALIKKRMATVIAPMDRESGPRGLRLRLQLSEFSDGINVVREGDVDVVEIGGAGVVTRLLRRLREPDNVVVIAVDAHANGRGGVFKRPFAGHASQTFAVGAAWLSRAAQRPIIICVPFLDEAGAIVLEWGQPILPPARDDQGADARITSSILDVLERAAGARPGQYVQPIGHDRAWDPAEQRWIERPSESLPPQRRRRARVRHALQPAAE